MIDVPVNWWKAIEIAFLSWPELCELSAKFPASLPSVPLHLLVYPRALDSVQFIIGQTLQLLECTQAICTPRHQIIWDFDMPQPYFRSAFC